MAEYQTLVSEHARFHRAAGSVIDKANSGKGATAESELNFDSEYGIASRSVVKAIMELKRKVGAS